MRRLGLTKSVECVKLIAWFNTFNFSEGKYAKDIQQLEARIAQYSD